MTEDVTEDWLLNEAVRIFQPRTGYRAGLDAVLLAAFLSGDHRTKALELGCGVGGALFPAAWRLNTTHFTGLEREPHMAELARRGATANAVSDRVDVVTGDAAELPSDWQNRFDLVFSNPPYFSHGKIQNPSEGRRHAYMADLPLQDWLKAMLFAACPKGRLVLIHRAGELGEILTYLMSRAGEISVFPIRSSPGEPAKRVIVSGRKGLRRGEIVLHDGLTMYERKGGRDYTAEALAIMAGGPIVLP